MGFYFLSLLNEGGWHETTTYPYLFSCTDQDSSICTELDEQLAFLRYNGTIETWYENRILAGRNRAEELKEQFEKADIILLFVSPRFFSNQICVDQMTHALQRAEVEGVMVVPTIIRACDWRHSPIAHLQPLPHNGNPISTSRSRGNKLLEVANEIRTIIEQKFDVSLAALPLHPQPAPSSGGLITPLERVRGLATNCVGREGALERLHTDFRDRNKHLFIIGGLDGMGKTTFAAQFATEISKEYNVLWINCDVIPVTTDSFLREIGRIASDQYDQSLLSVILDNPTIHADEKEGALLRFLAHVSHLDHEGKNHGSLKPIVLFLDGYHRVGDPALNQLILKIARSKVGTKIVLTLRQMPPDFGLTSGLVTEIPLSGLSETGCRRLMELQAESYPALKDDLDDEMFSRVWRRTRGVPAALELLVSMTRKRTLEDVLERLTGRDEDVFPELMRHLYESLFEELSEGECQVVIEASIFRRPMPRGALRAVNQSADVDEIIDKLIDRFILTFDGKHYSMNALLSDYTGSLLPFPKAKELHRRAAEFYCAYRCKNPTEKLLSQQESCYHFIRAGERVQAETMLIGIAASLRGAGFFQEFFDLLNQIEQGGRSVDPVLLHEKACVLYKQGEVDRAIALLEDLERTSDKQAEIQIKAQQELGWIFIEIGRRMEASVYLQNSRRLARSAKLPVLEAEALSRSQHIAYHQCQYEQALNNSKDHMGILEKIQSDPKISKKIRERIPEEIYWTKHEIANVYRERGEYEKALELYKEALAFFWQEQGSPRERVGWLLYDIGQIYRDKGMYQEAYRQFEMAFEIFHKMPHLFAQAHTEIELGRVGFKVGKSDAIEFVRRAIQTLEKVRGSAGVAYGIGALGQIYLWSGQLESALEEFQKSKEREKELGSTKGVAWALHQMSLVYFEQGMQFLETGNRVEACSCFQESQKTIEEAKRFFAAVEAIPNIRGIQDDAMRIKEQLVDCRETL